MVGNIIGIIRRADISPFVTVIAVDIHSVQPAAIVRRIDIAIVVVISQVLSPPNIGLIEHNLVPIGIHQGDEPDLAAVQYCCDLRIDAISIQQMLQNAHAHFHREWFPRVMRTYEVKSRLILILLHIRTQLQGIQIMAETLVIGKPLLSILLSPSISDHFQL